jgi:predicted amino acid-binding ACT domain protein
MGLVKILGEDKAGLLADLSYVLAKGKIRIDGIDIDEVGDRLAVGLTVKDRNKAISLLAANGYTILDDAGGSGNMHETVIVPCTVCA